MSKEAMELALKALETAWYHVEIISGDWADRAKNAIKALEEALNQEQDEPVGWLDSNDIHAEFMHKDLKAEHDKRGSFTPRMFQIPLYTTPQTKEWVGLTEEELIVIKGKTCPEIDWSARHGVPLNNGEQNAWLFSWFMAFAKETEDKLKNKNT